MIPQVEKWRSLVETALQALYGQNPAYKTLTDTFKKTFSGWVDIILAIIQKESEGNENTVGDNGNSIGLMQLNFGAGTPQDMGYTGDKEGLKDPSRNIYYGIKYFLYQLKRYQDIEKAIAAYNAGSVRYNQAGNLINVGYLTDVLNFLLSEKKTSLPSDSPPLDFISCIKQASDDIVLVIEQLMETSSSLKQFLKNHTT